MNDNSLGQLTVALFDTDGNETNYKGYERQKASIDILYPMGEKKITFPQCTGGESRIEKAMVFDGNGVLLAEIPLDIPTFISSGTGPAITFGESEIYEEEKQSSEPVRLLRNITENCVHIGGGDYRINEAYLQPAIDFLTRLTD